MDIDIQTSAQGGTRPLNNDNDSATAGLKSLRFAGAPDALYERHLKSDNLFEPASSNALQRY